MKEIKNYKTFSIRLNPEFDQIPLLHELSTIRNSIWNHFNSILLADFENKIKLKTAFDIFGVTHKKIHKTARILYINEKIKLVINWAFILFG